MSGAPIINGTNQLPNPPINVGITIKNIIINAWPVTISGLTTQSFPEGIYQIVDPKPHVRFSPHVALTPPHYSLL